MINKLRSQLILLLCLVLSAAFAHASEQVPAEKLAISAALDFLELADQGDYAACWENSSLLFKGRVDKQSWLEEIAHIRSQYQGRQRRSLQYSKPLTEAVDFNGQATLFLIFRSQFQQKTVAEMVTVSKDSDNRWRVAGYSIQ